MGYCEICGAKTDQYLCNYCRKQIKLYRQDGIIPEDERVLKYLEEEKEND